MPANRVLVRTLQPDPVFFFSQSSARGPPSPFFFLLLFLCRAISYGRMFFPVVVSVSSLLFFYFLFSSCPSYSFPPGFLREASPRPEPFPSFRIRFPSVPHFRLSPFPTSRLDWRFWLQGVFDFRPATYMRFISQRTTVTPIFSLPPSSFGWPSPSHYSRP